MISSGVLDLDLIITAQLDKKLKPFLQKTIKKFYVGASFDDDEIDAVKEAGKPVSQSWDFAQFFVRTITHARAWADLSIALLQSFCDHKFY